MSTLAIYHLIPEIVEISWLMNWDHYLRQKVDLDILSASMEPKRWKKNKALLRITSRLLTDSVNKQETPITNAIIIITRLVIVTWQPTVYTNAIRNKITTKPIINVHKVLNILNHHLLIFLHKDKIIKIRIFCSIIWCSFCLETKYSDWIFFSITCCTSPPQYATQEDRSLCCIHGKSTPSHLEKHQTRMCIQHNL